MTREELEVLGPDRLECLCLAAGLDGSGTKAELIDRLLEKPELIDRLLESEGQVSEPEPEPAEPTEPES